MLKTNLMLTLLCVAFTLLVAVPRNLVVLEIGTGTWCQYCPGASMGAHDLLENGYAVAVIKNHNGDPYANTYSNARNTFYAISGYPTAFFDGLNAYVGGSNTTSLYPTYLPRVTSRLAVASHYTLSATGSMVGNTINISASVAKPEADTNSNVKLMCVFTETNISQAWQGQTMLYQVNRLMTPDQNGTAVSLGTGGSTVINLSAVWNSAWNFNNGELVLFLQDMTTKEILQGVKYAMTDLTGGYPLSLDEHDFSFQPVGGTASFPVTIENFAAYSVAGTISTNNPAFTVSTGVYSIPAHGSQVFNVNFVPSAAQEYSGTLNLTGNLWNYPSIDVPLTGIGYERASDLDFAVSSGTYTPITDGAVLGTTTTRSVSFVDPTIPLGGSTTTGPGFPIGFDFAYLGKSFDRLAIHSNGWISLGQSALTPSVNLTSTSLNSPLGTVAAITPPHLVSRISALTRSLMAQTGADIRISTTGTSPNRECVIQWTNYRRINMTGDSFNFQIRLLENGDRIRFVYGNIAFSGTSSLLMDVGLRNTPDVAATNYNNLVTTTSWENPTTGTSSAPGMTLSATIKPSSGLTYTWTPQSSFPQAPILLSPANGAIDMPVSGFDLNWEPAVAGGAPEYYAVYLSDDENALFDQEYWETTSTSFDPVTDGAFTFGYDQRWFWTIQAFNASGTVLAQTSFRFDIESAPANQVPEATVVTGGNLGWPVVAGAQSYNIYKADMPFGTYMLVDNTLDPNWQDPDFPASKAFYKVTAVLGGREVPVLADKVRAQKN